MDIVSVYGRVLMTVPGESLRGAHLRDADLRGADLRGADLPTPSMMLEALWGTVSPVLCTLLMRYDAANHPGGVAPFEVWATGGGCPYATVRVARAALFQEDRALWRSDAPVLPALALMAKVLRERCANSDYHDGGIYAHVGREEA